MEREIKNPVLRFLVYGHVWLALGAAAQVWWANEFLNMHADARLIAFVALASLAAYCSMRLLRMNAPGLEHSPIMHWYRINQRVMLVLVGLALVGAVLIGWPFREMIIHALWLPGLLAALYTLPLVLTGGQPMGLRRIPFLKAFVIAFVWAGLAVVLPDTHEYQGDPFFSSDTLWFASIWAGFFFALAIVFDIRDLPHDRPSLRTFPQVFGQRWAKVIAGITLLPMLFMFLVMVTFSYYPIEPGWREPRVDWSLFLPTAGLAFALVLIAKADPKRPWWYWAILLDGLLILLPLLSWIGGLV